MKRLLSLIVIAAGLASCVTGPPQPGPEIEEKTGALFVVASFVDQVTGVAVTPSGRIFVNFPRWGRDPQNSVVECFTDGTTRPYPDAEWNRWGEGASSHPESHFVCVQSVYVDQNGFLWILDPASPSFKGVVPGGAKLLKVNLRNDRVERVYRFDDKMVPKAAYLNDVRLSPDGRYAYITESGTGALIVLDTNSGKSRRLLADDLSTKGEAGMVPVIGGKELRDRQGKPPQINADGIALDSSGDYLYYHALTARTLYRIKTSHLTDPMLVAADLPGYVERVAKTGPVDGMEMGRNDVLYYTALEENSVKYLRPDGVTGVVIRDDWQLVWPDSLSIGPDQYLYVTASQINRMPRFNNGEDSHVSPYRLFRVWLAPL